MRVKIINEAMTDEPIVIETVDSPSRFMRVTDTELDLKAIKKAIGIDRGFVMITDQDDQDQVSNLAQKLAKLPHNKNDVCAKATYKGKPVVIFDEEAGSEYGESGVATIFINPKDMPAILGTDNIEYVTSY